MAHSFEEERYLCLGSSKQGILLLISFTDRGDDACASSAREMTPKEELVNREIRILKTIITAWMNLPAELDIEAEKGGAVSSAAGFVNVPESVPDDITRLNTNR